ncbi:MAG: hypothetical protein HQK66_08950 [Desulfamplus sp.]|nr:hypothetical protein [Desulfamplus sp.]
MNLNMNAFTMTGIGAWLISLCILLFQGIAMAMEKGEEMTNIIMCDIAYDFFDTVSNKIPFETLRNWFDYVVFEMSLFLVLMIVGTILIVIGMFLQE